jgi:hypothetical protein
MRKTLTTIGAALLLAATIPASAGERVKTAFVTQGSYNGNLGGLSGADRKCQAEADGAGSVVPSGIYRAWLSDGSEGPSTRFTKSFDPVVLPDGTRIADGFPDLTSGRIRHPIDIDPTGRRVGLDYYWTGTNADGTPAPEFVTCDGWTAEAGAGGLAGSTTETDALWSAYRGGMPCNRTGRLVCFQQ